MPPVSQLIDVATKKADSPALWILLDGRRPESSSDNLQPKADTDDSRFRVFILHNGWICQYFRHFRHNAHLHGS